jgi:chemotaxis response regulator CheB
MYGGRVVGVLLTGMLDDGTDGLWHIKKHGGVTIVQDPADAQFPSMPQSAIENVGADYVLRLENIPKRLVELIRQERSNKSIGRAGAKVLIVEADLVVAKALQESLQDLGYQVVGSTESGERAVEIAAQKSPDVVLMDIRLAGRMSGVEAARQIWERSQIPIVYLTAHSDQNTLDQAKTTENYGYIVKPFHSDAVHAVIQLALERRQKELQKS